jgi:hypothetical protein
MIPTCECWLDGNDRGILVGWYLEGSVGWMELTGDCC